MMAGARTGDCHPCAKSELVYDHDPPTQVAIEGDYRIYAGPKAALTDDSPLTFEITGSGDDYVDLGASVLKLRIRVMTTDGEAVEHIKSDGTAGRDPHVAPVNGFMHSMFSQVDVSLNDTMVSQSTNTYPYRAYLTSLLSYGDAVKDTWLNMELWAEDEAHRFDEQTNKGHTTRRSYILNGREFDLKGRLHMDLSHQQRLIPNGVNARITLTRSKSAFVLMAFEKRAIDYRVVITHATLEVRKVKLVPKQQLHIENTIAKHGARLPVSHIVTKNFSIPQGVSTFDLDGLFMGQIPNSIVLGLVDNDAFNGSYDKNPFNFKHFDLSFLCLNVDGQQHPGRPLQPDYANKLYLDCYETLFTGTRMYGDDVSHGIDRAMYPWGYCLYVFNLTPDQSDGVAHINPRRHGNVRASLHFAQTLPCTVTLIALGQLDNVITVDKYRNIVFDYTT